MGLAEQIKDLVSIPEALRMYGIDEGRHHRIPCPIHGGKDANFAYTDKVYHCWVCGAKGDVISLTMALFGIGFGQALTRLNNDFQLGLTAEKPTAQSQAVAKKRSEARRAELARREWDKKVYLALAGYHARLMRMGADTDELERWLDENIEMAVVK